MGRNLPIVVRSQFGTANEYDIGGIFFVSADSHSDKLTLLYITVFYKLIVFYLISIISFCVPRQSQCGSLVNAHYRFVRKRSSIVSLLY